MEAKVFSSAFQQLTSYQCSVIWSELSDSDILICALKDIVIVACDTSFLL